MRTSNQLSQKVLAMILLAVFLFSCTQSQVPEVVDTTEIPSSGTSTMQQTAPPDSTPSAPVSQTRTELSSLPDTTPVTVATRSDYDWRDAPILPEISSRVYEIYRDGQAQGRDSHNFSVIGDCQSIPYVFMGPIALGVLQPESAESYLWDAIDYFNVAINHWSVTSRGGFTAASILAPIQADPHYCKAGESPLTCEYRLFNPAYVFITLETWLDQTTIDRYEFYLREILDYVIEKGTIPILLTKADAAEVDDGHHVINPAIARVAYDYNVPLVNFWRAAQYLDNIGIDPDRDGFHLSAEGYDVKNILALRALYNIWQAVEYGNITENEGQESVIYTPTTEPGETSRPDPQIDPPDCPGGCIFFGTSKSKDGNITADGVFAYNVDAKVLMKILESGYDLQDVSEDGQSLLVNHESYLYEINLTDSSASLISDSFLYMGNQGAYWNSDDSDVVYLDQTDALQTDTGDAFALIPTSRDGEIYFYAGLCSENDFCHSAGIYQFDIDTATTVEIPYEHPAFSPDGNNVAYLNPEAATSENYYHIGYLLMEDPDNSALSRRVFYFPEEHGFMIYPDVRDFAFSPDSGKLILIYDVYSAYFERSTHLQTYLIDLTSGILYDFGRLTGISASLNPHLVWAPQGDKIFFFLSNAPSDNQFTMDIYMTNLTTGEKLILFDESILVDEDYFYLTNIYWR